MEASRDDDLNYILTKDMNFSIIKGEKNLSLCDTGTCFINLPAHLAIPASFPTGLRYLNKMFETIDYECNLT